jgi:hypothetical protein
MNEGEAVAISVIRQARKEIALAVSIPVILEIPTPRLAPQGKEFMTIIIRY